MIVSQASYLPTWCLHKCCSSSVHFICKRHTHTHSASLSLALCLTPPTRSISFQHIAWKIWFPTWNGWEWGGGFAIDKWLLLLFQHFQMVEMRPTTLYTLHNVIIKSPPLERIRGYVANLKCKRNKTEKKKLHSRQWHTKKRTIEHYF